MTVRHLLTESKLSDYVTNILYNSSCGIEPFTTPVDDIPGGIILNAIQISVCLHQSDKIIRFTLLIFPSHTIDPIHSILASLHIIDI